MKEVLESLKKTPPVDYVKLAVMLVGFGIAIGRMEYQFNTRVDELKMLVQAHIIESKGKELLFTERLSNLKDKVDEGFSAVKIMRDFIRPDDVQIRGRRR